MLLETERAAEEEEPPLIRLIVLPDAQPQAGRQPVIQLVAAPGPLLQRPAKPLGEAPVEPFEPPLPDSQRQRMFDAPDLNRELVQPESPLHVVFDPRREQRRHGVCQRPLDLVLQDRL